MKCFNLLMGGLACIILSCGLSKSTVPRAQLDTFNEIIQKQQFRIESDWAYPQVTVALQQVLNSNLLPMGSTAGAINLMGNSNFLTVSGDSISSYLPYFGERHMNVDYGGRDNVIQFDGIMNDYKAKKVKGDSYQITFKAKCKSESFDIYIKLNPNLTSNMILNGTSRRTIRYSGKVIPIGEK